MTKFKSNEWFLVDQVSHLIVTNLRMRNKNFNFGPYYICFSTIRRELFSLLIFSLLSHVQVISYGISAVCRSKYPCTYSSRFYFP